MSAALSPESTLAVKTDFPDWLSPMLVKELRQGVRTRVFVSLFILLQLLMLLTVSLSLLVSAHGEDTSAGTAFFWIMVGFPVLIVLPFNGMNSVAAEIKANTLELIFLTRLTAFRIIVGKWFAIFAQSLLLVCAVLPYLVLRYFIGGVNVTTELTTLAAMLGGSALLSALATGLSAYPARAVRPLTAILGFFAFIFGIDMVGSMFAMGRVGAGTGPDALEITFLVLCGGIVLVLLLEVGAARIAPPAENHSAAMRALALGGFVLSLAAGLVVRRAASVTTTAFVIAFVVCAIALCEKPRWIPGLFRPFATRGWPGRMAGRLLYPGWHTGVFFTLAVFTAFGVLLWCQKAFATEGYFTLFIAAGGVLLFPVALVRALVPRTDKATAIFFAVQGFSAIVTVFCIICDGALRTSFKSASSFLPLSTLIMSVSDARADTAARGLAVGVTTLGSLGVLLLAAFDPLRRTRLVERECLQLPVPPPDAPLA